MVRLVFWICGVAALAAALGGMAFILRQGAQPQAETAVLPQSRDFVVRGRLEPEGGVIDAGAFSQVASPTLGRLFVNRGDIVRQGDVIAELSDAPALAAEVAAAAAEVEVARRRRDDVKTPYRPSEVLAATAARDVQQVEVGLASAQTRRNKELSAGVRADAERERDTASLARAQAQLAKAEADLAMVTEVSQTKIAIAEAEVRLAEARLAARQAAASLAVIRAPAAGRVLRVLARPGEMVGGRPIVELADMDHLKVVAEVDERLIDRIASGMAAQVQVRGGTASWPARVRQAGSIVLSSERLPVDAATGAAGRFVEVELALESREGLPEVAGLELSVRFPGAAPAR